MNKCQWCNVEVYIRRIGLMKPIAKDFMRGKDVVDTLGLEFVHIQKNFCPVCGRAVDREDVIRKQKEDSNE